MNNNQDRGAERRSHKLELKFAQDLDRVYGLAGNAGVERLGVLKQQLLGLLLRLEQEAAPAATGGRPGVNVREEISKLVWSLEDWKIQFEGRN